MVKIFVATPMYGGQCFGWYTSGMLGLQTVFAQSQIQMTYSTMYNESLIPRARNALTCAFLKSDCTHLLFIDADIKFEPIDVPPMIAANKEIICGIYPKKEINFESVARAVQAGAPPQALKHYTGAWVINLLNYADNVTVPAGEPLEINNGGTGFMLIKREVFEKLMPTSEVYLNDVHDQAGTIGAKEEIYKFFDTPIEPETRRLLSEDYAFCYNWRKLGGKVWAAPWVRLGHAGTYLYEGMLIGMPMPSGTALPTSHSTPQSEPQANR